MANIRATGTAPAEGGQPTVMLSSIIIAVGLSVLAVSAGAHAGNPSMAYVHFATAAVIVSLLALVALRGARVLRVTHAPEATISAHLARHMGLVWTWGALALLITYPTGVLSWHEWWQFFLAFAVAAALCLFFAATLTKDAESGSTDATLLKLGRYLTFAQLGGMILVMVGLVIDGKMTRFINPRPGWEDWAANNIFFCGAFALSIISAYAIAVTGQERKAD